MSSFAPHITQLHITLRHCTAQHGTTLFTLPYGIALPLYYMLISKARRLVNEESGIILATVTKEGYRRLPPDVGVEHAGTHPMHRIRRTARRAGRSLTNSIRHTNDLQPAQRRRAHQNLTVFGLVEHLTNRRTINTIPDDPPPEADALAELRRIIGGAR